MNIQYILNGALAGLLILTACGPDDKLAEAKADLSKKKSELSELKAEIAALEEQIGILDTTSRDETRLAQIVTTLPVKSETFEHFVEVRGDVQSDRNVVVSAESGGAVEQIYVEEGQKVNKGQLLVRLDDAILRNSISEVETQRDLAKAVYDRQKNLYDQNIGTEVQFLQAKANFDALNSRMRTLQTQLAQAQVRAPFSGTIEALNVKLGEMAQPGRPLVQLVSLQDMYIQADVSESYIGKFERGSSVEVFFPSLEQNYTTKLTAVGQVINVQNRTFSIEASLPKDAKLLRPNLMAVLKIKDFERPQAITVPTNLIQRDNKGEYVYLVKGTAGTKLVKKQHVETGLSYNNHTLIVQGLTDGDVLVNDGFREVNDGVNVRISESTIATSSN